MIVTRTIKTEYGFWGMQVICLLLSSGTDAEFAIESLVALIPLNILAFLVWPKLEKCERATGTIKLAVWLSPLSLLFAVGMIACAYYTRRF